MTDDAAGDRHRRRRRRRATAPQGPPPPPSASAAPSEALSAAASAAASGDARRGKPDKPRAPRRGGHDGAGDRGLRDLVGAGRSQVGVDGALRARDVNRPTEEDLAAAEAEVVIVRRNWKPRADG